MIGEDEVGVRLGQRAPLLPARAEPDAPPAAGARARSLPCTRLAARRPARRPDGSQQARDPRHPVRRVVDEPARRPRRPATDGRGEQPQRRARPPTAAPSRIAIRIDRGAEVAAEQDQPDQQRRRPAAAAPAGASTGRAACCLRASRSAPQRTSASLAELGRLELERTAEVDPVPVAVDLDADAGDVRPGPAATIDAEQQPGRPSAPAARAPAAARRHQQHRQRRRPPSIAWLLTIAHDEPTVRAARRRWRPRRP